MIKKYYELSQWEKVRHNDDVLTFHRMDGAYAQFFTENNDMYIWHYDSYELGDDWIYIPKI